ncbi:hypothetical protein [Frondihabitans peucedani]|uniref:Galactosyltransferase C-terminal domain-containing protein n=1 Tax=Frondihabitans peucedani TaxID=598626 RepID=A0ABP8DX96_9MICO
MVTVVLPWRPQPSRVEAFEAVSSWYRENLPEARVVTVDSDDEVFNLARCRNLGVAGVEAAGDDVVVIGDADTLPQPAPLREALEACLTSGRVHLPYTEYHWLGRSGTAAFRDGTPLEECDFELVRGACSGVYVTTPATWWSHGGQDERFRGWGFEDAAWYVAHETLLGEVPRRHEGAVFALHHETQLREGPQYDANSRLMDDYRRASTDRVSMDDFVFGTSASNARIRPGV